MFYTGFVIGRSLCWRVRGSFHRGGSLSCLSRGQGIQHSAVSALYLIITWPLK